MALEEFFLSYCYIMIYAGISCRADDIGPLPAPQLISVPQRRCPQAARHGWFDAAAGAEY
jgi:hypothetical protein